jgi:hypothetical protein
MNDGETPEQEQARLAEEARVREEEERARVEGSEAVEPEGQKYEGGPIPRSSSREETG